MMKIVLATCGSRGDVQPLIALCRCLKKAGHDLLVLGPPEKKEWAREMGCVYQKTGRDITAFINQMKNAVTLDSAKAFASLVQKEVKSQFKALPGLIKGADLVIGASLMFALPSVADDLNIQWRYMLFTPCLLPSDEHPFVTVKTQTFPKWVNKLSWKTASVLDRLYMIRLINRHRKIAGLDPVDNLMDYILKNDPIVACDREIAQVPADVDKRYIQTGYLHLKDLPQKGLPLLDSFLEQGDKPVYAGFGSMPPEDQEKITPLLITAARNLGKRIIIAKHWEKFSEQKTASDVLFLKSSSHLKLFPHTCAVIHHGGAGTTAAAAASGVPQIIVPHILDQYFQGYKIFSSGLGPKPINRSHLKVKKLSAALEQCLFNHHIKQAAEKTGQSINPCRSLQMAVKTIEQSSR